MKAELTKGGYIKVTAETVTEAWALNGVWPIGVTGIDRDKNEDRLIVDCSILSDEQQKRFDRLCKKGIDDTREALGIKGVSNV